MKTALVKGFKLNGQSMASLGIPLAVRKITEFLDKQASDELFSADELSRILRVHHDDIRRSAVRTDGYSVLIHPRKRLWGSKAAILNWQKTVGA